LKITAVYLQHCKEQTREKLWKAQYRKLTEIERKHNVKYEQPVGPFSNLNDNLILILLTVSVHRQRILADQCSFAPGSGDLSLSSLSGTKKQCGTFCTARFGAAWWCCQPV